MTSVLAIQFAGLIVAFWVAVRTPIGMRDTPRIWALLQRLGLSKWSALWKVYNLFGVVFMTSWITSEMAIHVATHNFVVASALLWYFDLRQDLVALGCYIGISVLCFALVHKYATHNVEFAETCRELQAELTRFDRINNLFEKETTVLHLRKRRADTIRLRQLREMFRIFVAVPQVFDVISTVQVDRNVRYADHADRLLVDVYRSRNATPTCTKRRPILLYLHGGAWLQGNKGHSPPMLTYLAQRGIVCVSAQYRLLDDEKHAFPVNLVDIKHCVVWLRRNAHKFGADPNFIVSCGGSAGGHLAALLALTNDERDRSLLQPGFTSEDTRVQACVSFYAPLDLGQDPTDTIDGLRDWLAHVIIKRSLVDHPTMFDLISPIHHARTATTTPPPFLVIQGMNDTLVPPDVASRFVDALRARKEGRQIPDYLCLLGFANHAFDLTASPRTVAINRLVHHWIRSMHAYQRKQSTSTIK